VRATNEFQNRGEAFTREIVGCSDAIERGGTASGPRRAKNFLREVLRRLGY
jgi:hypothetical protein